MRRPTLLTRTLIATLVSWLAAGPVADPEFPPLTLGALHTGELKPVAERFLQLVRDQAGLLRKALRKGN